MGYLYALGSLSFIAGAALYHRQLERQNAFEQSIVSKKPFEAYVENIEKINVPQFGYKIILMRNTTKERLLIFSRHKPSCDIGDTIFVRHLTLAPIKNQKFRHFLLRENILGCSHTTKLNLKVLQHPRFNFTRLCTHIRNSIEEALQKKMNSTSFVLWQTIFLGKKAQRDEMQEIKTVCRNWGISHYLARSGLHLMLFIYLWVMLLKCIPLSFLLKQLILLFLVLLYNFLSITSISFLRALLTFFLYKFCVIQKLEIRPLYMVNLACLIALLYSPAQLFYLDFQLSYALTAAIALFYELTMSKKFLLQSS